MIIKHKNGVTIERLGLLIVVAVLASLMPRFSPVS